MIQEIKREWKWLKLDLREARERFGFWILPGKGYDEAFEAHRGLRDELSDQYLEASRERDLERRAEVKAARRELDRFGEALGGSFKPFLPVDQQEKIDAAVAAVPIVIVLKTLNEVVDE